MKQWTVDAFASGPFMGNPACVLEPFDVWPDEAWMQALAQENNQAETAFLRRTADPARYDLRWFTPAVEVPLCGHATLASAHVLLEELSGAAEALTFDTRSGPLIVRRGGEGYEMDFPADPPRPIPVPDGLAEAIGASVREVVSAAYLLAVLEDEAAVRRVDPDIAAVNRISRTAGGGRGDLIVSALAEVGRPYDVVSRFFAPGAGVSEDPATGSAHCILAPFWTERLGRNPLRFHQAYPGRGGDLECEVRGDRVLLRGRAVTVLEGRLRAAA